MTANKGMSAAQFAADPSKSFMIIETAVFFDYMDTHIKPYLELLTAEKPADVDPFVDYPELLTRKQTADILAITRPTVDKWSRDGRLKKHNIHGSPRFKKSEVLKFKKWLSK